TFGGGSFRVMPEDDIPGDEEEQDEGELWVDPFVRVECPPNEYSALPIIIMALSEAVDDGRVGVQIDFEPWREALDRKSSEIAELLLGWEAKGLFTIEGMGDANANLVPHSPKPECHPPLRPPPAPRPELPRPTLVNTQPAVSHQ